MRNFILWVSGGILFLGLLDAVDPSKTASIQSKQETASPRPTPSIQVPNPAKAAACKKLLMGINKDDHILKSWRRDGNYVTVEVRGGYYLADFDDKRFLDATIRCAVTEGRQEDPSLDIVSYLDARSHKEVAQWGYLTGFDVKN